MKEKMMIGGFNDPNVSRENYRNFAESGLNTVIINRKKESLAKLEEALSFCDEFGLNALVDVQTHPEFFGHDGFKKFKSFYGFYIYDEPIVDDFGKIVEMIEPFEKRFSKNKLFFVNLNPDQWDTCAQKLHAKNYTDYVEQFCEIVLSKIHGKKILSVDIYPLIRGFHGLENSIDNRYLEVFETIAIAAKKYGAETHAYIQTMGYGEMHRSPSIEDIRFQFAVGFAYGFKRFSHFCYYTPGGSCADFAKDDYAMVYKNDALSPIYYYVKEANAEAQIIFSALKDAKWKRTAFIDGETCFNPFVGKHFLQNACFIPSGIKKISSEYDVLIGEYENNGKTLYVVVNFTNPIFKKRNKVSISFDNKNKVNVVFGDRTKEETLSDGSLCLELNYGECAVLL